VIVTGGNSGLGLEAEKVFAHKNAKVILACRSVEKGEIAKNSIVTLYPNADITVYSLDLADLESIKSFATKILQSLDKLDILLNNAGIMMTPYQLTKDGFESQLGTNHLGHFALTGLLLELLKNTPKSRVVNVSSNAHKQGTMDYDNLQYDKGNGYTPIKAYCRSKLANLLFTYELQRYFDANKIDCKAIVAHPGMSDTNLFNNITSKWLTNLLRPVFKLFTQSAEMGVLPELRAATDIMANGSEYYGPDGKNEMKGYPVIVQPIDDALSIDSARKLWEASEKLTGVTYN
jgi:NAD(P)-dependent dehydrogenase (short-subunit alcohol dehydrogenase family)